MPEIVYTIFVTVFLYPVILLLNRTPDDADKRSDHWFAKRIKESLFDMVTSRLLLLFIIFIAMAAVLIYRIFDLQIVNGESYLNNFQLKIQKRKL